MLGDCIYVCVVQVKLVKQNKYISKVLKCIHHDHADCFLFCRRHAATLCSPFILLYGLALCCLQYVWAMELQPELPTTVGTMSLKQLGLDRAQYPCLRLGAMVK